MMRAAFDHSDACPEAVASKQSWPANSAMKVTLRDVDKALFDQWTAMIRARGQRQREAFDALMRADIETELAERD